MDIVLALLDKLYKENFVEQQDAKWLIENLGEQHFPVLFDYALKTRQKNYGNKVFMRGLIEFSNICRQNCKYCGLRCSNNNVERYRLSKEEILDCCRHGRKLGFSTFVLQSGEDAWYTVDKMVDIISSIKQEFPECALTLSIGERSYDEYKKMYDAGADRYLLRHETASRELYEELDPGMSFDNRRACLRALKDIGFQVGAGYMVGLPGQNSEHLALDLMFLKELSPHMIGIGPFIPHSETPLAAAAGGTVSDTLKMLALTRLFVPNALMPATTALGTLHKNGRELALKAGANVVMPILTPMQVKAQYELYENKICIGDEAAHCRVCIEGRIKSAGFEVDMGRGDCCS